MHMPTHESRQTRQKSAAVRLVLRLTLVVLCAAPSGCNLVINATRNACYEPTRLCTEYKERCSHRSLAKKVWSEVQAQSADVTFSEHYGRGFRQGFVDFIWAGGTGQPPPIPPRPYWKFRYESSEGYEDIRDWFDGYRHGTAMAEAGGYRELVVIPTRFMTQAGADEEHGTSCEDAQHLPMPRVVGKPSNLPPMAPPSRALPGSQSRDHGQDPKDR